MNEIVPLLILGALWNITACNIWFHCEQGGQHTALVEQPAGVHWASDPKIEETRVLKFQV